MNPDAIALDGRVLSRSDFVAIEITRARWGQSAATAISGLIPSDEV